MSLLRGSELSGNDDSWRGKEPDGNDRSIWFSGQRGLLDAYGIDKLRYLTIVEAKCVELIRRSGGRQWSRRVELVDRYEWEEERRFNERRKAGSELIDWPDAVDAESSGRQQKVHLVVVGCDHRF